MGPLTILEYVLNEIDVDQLYHDFCVLLGVGRVVLLPLILQRFFVIPSGFALRGTRGSASVRVLVMVRE